MGLWQNILWKNVGSFAMEKRESLMEMNVFLWHLRRNLYRSLWMNCLNGWRNQGIVFIHWLWAVYFIMSLSLFIHLLMVMEEWQDYGTLRFCLNGNLYLSIFQSKARLKNFRMNIMMRLPDVMFRENLPFL